MSSTTSSFLDRLKRGGDSSSRTSLEEEYGPPTQDGGQEFKLGQQDLPLFEGGGRKDTTLAGSVGYTLWSRLASAAGALGVDVSNARANDISVQSGEETPPGEESRLTQAMKAYHIQKARDPTDLPGWLFDEHERRPFGRSQIASRHGGYDETHVAPTYRGLRDIYDAAVTAPSTSSRTAGSSTSRHNRFADEPLAPSKATNHLKSLREAKRQNSRLDDNPVIKRTSRSEDGQGVDKIWLRPRVGLPPRPVRKTGAVAKVF